MSRLQIHYRTDDPYDGWIDVKLTGEFSGSGGFSGAPVSFWAFAQGLAAYPLGGAVRFEEGDVLIEVVPIDSVGHLRLTVELGHPAGVGSFLRLVVPTDYSGMAGFREALAEFIHHPDQGLCFEI